MSTLAGLIVGNPAFAHVRMVDCYAAGPLAVDRVAQLCSVASILMLEGYRSRPKARGLPASCADATAAALFAIVQRDVARGDLAMVPRRLPQLTYLALAPFMGPLAAIRVVGELSGESSDTPARIRVRTSP